MPAKEEPLPRHSQQELCGSAQALPSGDSGALFTLEVMANAEALLPHPEPAAVEIVIPVHNEEHDLERNVRLLRRYLDTRFPLSTLVTIADNASTDSTWLLAQRLAGSLPGVTAVHFEEKGRGRAVKNVWARSDALVVAYMDVDLSTGLNALLPLVAPLLSDHAEIAIGTRLGPGSRVARGPKREIISRGYNLILHAALGSRFSDAQCGFKAVRADVARELIPRVEDSGWFFDTELLVLAERAGLRIHEVAVDWVDDADSRVDIVSTATTDLRGVWRLLRTGSRRSRRAGRHHRPCIATVTALSEPAR
jgi:glycosyltransferase involved in cell wall biosynthesis